MTSDLTTFPELGSWSIAAGAPSKGSNVRTKVVCNRCGTEREAWLSNYRRGNVTCKVCKQQPCYPSYTAVGLKLPFALLKDGEFQLLWGYVGNGDDLICKELEVLYKFTDGITAKPYKDAKGLITDGKLSVPQQVAKLFNAPPPKPPSELPSLLQYLPPLPLPGFRSMWIVVPSRWINFYVGSAELDGTSQDEALKYYADRLRVKNPSLFPEHSPGNSARFIYRDTEHAFLYCVDDRCELTELALLEQKELLDAALKRPRPIIALKAP